MPYAETAVPPPGSADRALAAGWSRIEAMLPGRLRRFRQERLADAAIALGPAMADLTEPRFAATAESLRARLVRRGLRHDLVAQSFALVREASRRHLGLRHHRVQLVGGAAMLGRTLAEMETGEGKTITAALPAALFALAGRPVHVVTVNDYLAQRDAGQLGCIYAALGLSVGVVIGDQTPEQRRAAYRCDVVYCTNKDLVFDYLRDRMALGARRSQARLTIDDLIDSELPRGERRDGLFLRGLHVAIVDEADSVLIDEARTPLILSGLDDDGASAERYATALALAGQLTAGEHYEVDARHRSLAMKPAGRHALHALASGMTGVWTARRARDELVEQALTALCLYRRDTDYVVDDGKIQIVDEHTGRVMPDRSWEHGLHQMIEAKEGCDVSGRRKTLARITYQRFFTRYGHLCGMTGTAAENRTEFAAVFGLRVLRVPTHHRLRREQQGVRLTPHAAAKWAAVAARVRVLSQAGRPVLVGTRSVAASEHLAALLAAAGMRAAVLNAQQNREEALIVARAGQRGSITVATDMAGRGTDIRLDRQVREAGGLHVILTEHHESGRIDRQLFGRCARQGDPGSVEAIVAADDELFRRFASRRLLRATRRSRHGVRLLVWLAQRRAEAINATIRRNTIREDKRLDTALAFAGRGE